MDSKEDKTKNNVKRRKLQSIYFGHTMRRMGRSYHNWLSGYATERDAERKFWTTLQLD